MEKELRHRPGAFKQQNKVHKTGRHKSKGQLQNEAKGEQVFLFYDCIVDVFYWHKSNFIWWAINEASVQNNPRVFVLIAKCCFPTHVCLDSKERTITR